MDVLVDLIGGIDAAHDALERNAGNGLDDGAIGVGAEPTPTSETASGD